MDRIFPLSSKGFFLKSLIEIMVRSRATIAPISLLFKHSELFFLFCYFLPTTTLCMNIKPLFFVLTPFGAQLLPFILHPFGVDMKLPNHKLVFLFIQIIM
jgi:hypothetical protein